MNNVHWRGIAAIAIGLLGFPGCSSIDGGASDNGSPLPVSAAGGGGTASNAQGGAGAGTSGSAGSQAPRAGDNGGGRAGTTASPTAAGSGAGGSVAGASGSGTAGMTGMTIAPPTPAGPEDGDPSAPIVAVSGITCGGAGALGPLGGANHQIDGRDMIVTYPCMKHAGAPVTFILNLHGTTPLELHFYQHGYFSAHNFTASHNLVIVTPSSVVQQWGNGDNGQDEPHLMKIIEWVYASFHGDGKFDIRSMWVGGHSWGGGYTARFGCKPELADKVKGLILMSGGGIGGFGSPACANNVSVIISTAEGDGRMPSDQTMLATSHGCGAMQSETILMNDHTFWPECRPGFVHANYYMRGKEHATSMDRDVVESIVDWIKLARP